MGIGLHIAQEYAKLMQGSLSIASTPGVGSIFTFTFPKKESLEHLAISPLNSFVEKEASNGHAIIPVLATQASTLLIVEDNVGMQVLLQQIVSPPYQVLPAANGKVALEILEKQTVHGVITDLMMPQMDGFELVAKMKAHEKWRHIPIVVLTARANEMDKLQALRMGVDDYLYKPFSPEELQARVNNLLFNYQNRMNTQSGKEAVEESSLNIDQQWLAELELQTMELLKKNPNFLSIDIAAQMNISEGHLRRKIRNITGLSANDYIKEIRLQYARQLLEQRAIANVSKLAYTVGFATPRYFTDLYMARFGKKPSSYLHN
jgi:DNA-binding response OmpR family regulator